MTDIVKVRTKGEIASMTHPSGAVATQEGGEWPRDQFFFRRQLDGDVEEIKDETPAEPPAPEDDTKPARGKTQKD